MPDNADRLEVTDPAMLALDADRVDRLAAGEAPDPGDTTGRHLAAWRDEIHRPVGGWVEDSAGWHWERDLSPSGAPTQILPAVPGGRVTYGDAYDYTAVPADDGDRPDGWCEDRSPELGEITRNDGED